MPESCPRARAAVMTHIAKAGIPELVLDVGVGSGYYGKAIKQLHPSSVVYGVEIWPTYITDHLGFYAAVFVADLVTFNYALIAPWADLVLACDVLEHLEKKEAVAAVTEWKRLYPWIIASLPIQRVEQGPYKGNIHEVHVHHWTASEIERDLGLKMIADTGICGVFEWRR